MLLDQSTLRTIHRYCTRNRHLVERSATAGCFKCGATFAPADVKEWDRERDEVTGEVLEESAKCPHCGARSVLPSAAPLTLTPQMLFAMQAYWFDQAH